MAWVTTRAPINVNATIQWNNFCPTYWQSSQKCDKWNWSKLWAILRFQPERKSDLLIQVEQRSGMLHTLRCEITITIMQWGRDRALHIGIETKNKWQQWVKIVALTVQFVKKKLSYKQVKIDACITRSTLWFISVECSQKHPTTQSGMFLVTFHTAKFHQLSTCFVIFEVT